MKDRNPQAGMFAIVLIVFIISGGGTAVAQTGEPPAPAGKTEEKAVPATGNGDMLNTANKLRLQFEEHWVSVWIRARWALRPEAMTSRSAAGAGPGSAYRWDMVYQGALILTARSAYSLAVSSGSG